MNFKQALLVLTLVTASQVNAFRLPTLPSLNQVTSAVKATFKTAGNKLAQVTGNGFSKQRAQFAQKATAVKAPVVAFGKKVAVKATVATKPAVTFVKNAAHKTAVRAKNASALVKANAQAFGTKIATQAVSLKAAAGLAGLKLVSAVKNHKLAAAATLGALATLPFIYIGAKKAFAVYKAKKAHVARMNDDYTTYCYFQQSDYSWAPVNYRQYMELSPSEKTYCSYFQA